MTDTKLIPNRVIVDRTVLLDLLLFAKVAAEDVGNAEAVASIDQLRDEVREGQRVELYADSFPLKSKE